MFGKHTGFIRPLVLCCIVMETQTRGLRCCGLTVGSFHQGFERLMLQKEKNILGHMEDRLKTTKDLGSGMVLTTLG